MIDLRSVLHTHARRRRVRLAHCSRPTGSGPLRGEQVAQQHGHRKDLLGALQGSCTPDFSPSGTSTKLVPLINHPRLHCCSGLPLEVPVLRHAASPKYMLQAVAKAMQYCGLGIARNMLLGSHIPVRG